jgi:diacylglycerol kinase (ATP)
MIWNRLAKAARVVCEGQIVEKGSGVKRLWRATINSWNGIVAAAQSEQAFREELVMLAIGAPLAFFLTEDAGKRFALIGVLVFLVIVELLNTAIEKLSDRVSLDHDPVLKRVKDMGSAAILLSLLLAGALWLWVAFEWFWL